MQIKLIGLALTVVLLVGARGAAADFYSLDHVGNVAKDVFGEPLTGLQDKVNAVFPGAAEQQPVAYVLGSQRGLGIIAGIRYGDGTLTGLGCDGKAVGWNVSTFGPSGSFVLHDKILMLIYGAKDREALLASDFRHGGEFAEVAGSLSVRLFEGDGATMVSIMESGGVTLGASVESVAFYFGEDDQSLCK